MILPVRQSSQKSICVRWKSFLNIMEDFFDELTCLFEKNSTGGSDEFRGGYLF